MRPGNAPRVLRYCATRRIRQGFLPRRRCGHTVHRGNPFRIRTRIAEQDGDMPPVAVSSTYLLHPTPLGDILIVSTPDAVISCHPVYADPGDDLAALTLALRAEPSPGTTDAALQLAAQLDEYFAGKRTAFDVQLDWRLVRGFTRDALEAVTLIPFGETAGYGEVALMAGRARAARAVGTACATTPFSIVVPVHRVIRADGSIGEYGGHPETKRFLLDLESNALERAQAGRAV